jgi:dCMP deaminase
MLINAGIERIVYEQGYPDQLAEEMIEEAGITVLRFAGAHMSGEAPA